MPSARSVRKPPSRSRRLRAIERASARSPGVQLDVESEQKRPGSNRDRAGTGVRCVAVVERPLRIAPTRGEPFELTAPDVREVQPMRRGRGRTIQQRRNPQLTPDARRRPVRERHRIIERRVAQRHERQHIERPNARMFPTVPAQIDPFERHARQRNSCCNDLRSRTRRRYDAAVMDGIARAMNDPCPFRAHRRNSSINRR